MKKTLFFILTLWMSGIFATDGGQPAPVTPIVKPPRINNIATQPTLTATSQFSRGISSAQKLEQNSIKLQHPDYIIEKSIQHKQHPAHKFMQEPKTQDQLNELNTKTQELSRYINDRNNYRLFSKFRQENDITKNPADEKRFQTLPQATQKRLIDKGGIITKEVKLEKARQRVTFAIVGTAFFVLYKCFGDLRTVFSD